MKGEACNVKDKATWGPTGRVGIVTEALVNGQAMTVREVAELAGLTIQGAYAMLCSLSYQRPIYDDPATGKWHYLK
jgi:hypothetical protein